jgi:cytochrome P450
MPERFSEQRECEIPRGAYTPFGAGLRACLGRGVSMLEMPVLARPLQRRCRITLDSAWPKPRPERQACIVSRGGIRLRLQAR